MGEPCNSRPSYCEVLVQLVRDLSVPRAPSGCMLLDTVYKASVSKLQVRQCSCSCSSSSSSERIHLLLRGFNEIQF